jgi:hypothetical protein
MVPLQKIVSATLFRAHRCLDWHMSNYRPSNCLRSLLGATIWQCTWHFSQETCSCWTITLCFILDQSSKTTLWVAGSCDDVSHLMMLYTWKQATTAPCALRTLLYFFAADETFLAIAACVALMCHSRSSLILVINNYYTSCQHMVIARVN